MSTNSSLNTNSSSNNILAGSGTTARKKSMMQLVWGLGFLAPNILGFLMFTTIPLVFAMVLAFTDWNLRLHNDYAAARDPEVSIRWVGFENFVRLLSDPLFYKYLVNTLFMMMGMPFGIAASLIAAIMLSKDLGGGSRRVFAMLIASATLMGSVVLLLAGGMGGKAILFLVSGLFGAILIGGTAGGTTIYRTLFYVPHFTAGVATLLLWKKLYNAQNGPINLWLAGPLDALDGFVKSSSVTTFQAGPVIAAVLVLALAVLGFARLKRMWQDGDLGPGAAVLPVLFMLTPVLCALYWWGGFSTTGGALGQTSVWMTVGVLLTLCVAGFLAIRSERVLQAKSAEGLGSALMLSAALMVGMFVVIGLGTAWYILPAKSAAGTITPPIWLSDGGYYWAKPAIMLIGFWGAVGSNTMLLYLAALTNVPQELYEAADIDGATPFSKFWNVTWPQLAPTTFFIVVMGVIGGLQGGFESARVLTAGGPAGSTTTLAYFIYAEGFETGRLGFSSAVAWTLFLLVLAVTLFNWKFGNKYVND